jgi:hypothetical protein
MIRKDLEGSVPCLFEILALDLRKITKNFRIAGLPTETETEHLPNRAYSVAATLTCSVWSVNLGQQTTFIVISAKTALTWMNKSVCRVHTICSEAESKIN